MQPPPLWVCCLTLGAAGAAWWVSGIDVVH
jgi:hypothetical protein